MICSSKGEPLRYRRGADERALRFSLFQLWNGHFECLERLLAIRDALQSCRKICKQLQNYRTGQEDSPGVFVFLINI
jgi:hypothetical protein